MTTSLDSVDTPTTTPEVVIHRTRERDLTARWLALVATLVSIASTTYFFRRGEILLYMDSFSHMEIARRVLFSPTAGPAQLGYVWLPLPHILMLPFAWINTLYYDGLAGSIISMVSYVVASVLIYKIVFHLTGGSKVAALVGAFVFMANPNVLYMQSTPMTELLLFATMLGGIYGIQRWAQTEKRSYLFGGGFSLILASLARYEGWVLAAALVTVVVYTCLIRHYSWVKLKAIVIISAATSFLGILFWVAWNVYYFGNPLAFEDGTYAKPSNWVYSGDLQLKHPLVSLKTYWYAIDDNLHLLVIGLAIAGLLLLLIKHRLSAESMPTLVTLVFVPFFVLALDEGQRPLDVIQINGSLYNVRFGLIMVIPAAILIGYLASIFNRRMIPGVALATILIVFVGLFTYNAFQKVDTNIITLKDPVAGADAKGGAPKIQAAAANYLKLHYKDGLVLEQGYGNEELLFDARISSSVNIYEGSYKLWQPALKNPLKSHVEWIIMPTPATMLQNSYTDLVYTSLHGSTALLAYRLVYNQLGYLIYERK